MNALEAKAYGLVDEVLPDTEHVVGLSQAVPSFRTGEAAD